MKTHNSTLIVSGGKIKGNNNTIYGDDNYIIGHNNTCYGVGNSGEGNNNKFYEPKKEKSEAYSLVPGVNVEINPRREFFNVDWNVKDLIPSNINVPDFDFGGNIFWIIGAIIVFFVALTVSPKFLIGMAILAAIILYFKYLD